MLDLHDRRASTPGEGAFVPVLLSRRRVWPALLVLLMLLVQACGDARSGPELTIEFGLVPEPPSVGPSELWLELSTPQGEALTGAALRVEATMAHAGMVPEFADCVEAEPGRYTAAFDFTMGGDWILIVNVSLERGGTAQRVLEVPRVAARRAE